MRATTGAAPVPVPPPIPAVINTCKWESCQLALHAKLLVPQVLTDAAHLDPAGVQMSTSSSVTASALAALSSTIAGSFCCDDWLHKL